jgi:hypothetical protein
VDNNHYTHTTYETSCVHLDGGTYTLEELKELVAAMQKMNQAAYDSMQPTKELP